MRRNDAGHRLASLGLALLAFALLSAVTVLIFRATTIRHRLVSRNEGERTLSMLFASLRDHDSFSSAVESSEVLRRKVIGIGAYSDEGELLDSWGRVPPARPSGELLSDIPAERAREYRENPGNDSFILMLRSPPPPPRPAAELELPTARPPRRYPLLPEAMRRADLVYLEIRQTDFWRGQRLRLALFPIVEVLLAALVLFVRALILRNAEYRRRIEEQKNLVAMGIAASTLAHEIKNPLLSIRLQAGIIERTCAGIADRETAIINSEVDRLSMLTHHVNDFLRDPAGQPQIVDPAQIAREVLQRLCASARPEVRSDGARIRFDPERLRSVLENLVRNALESGGPAEQISLEIGRLAGRVYIDVLDRGKGLSAEDRQRLFDPFFTTKSRGTGIGLSICRRFVTAAQGSLSLDPRPDGGLRARIEVPEVEA